MVIDVEKLDFALKFSIRGAGAKEQNGKTYGTSEKVAVTLFLSPRYMIFRISTGVPTMTLWVFCIRTECVLSLRP